MNDLDKIYSYLSFDNIGLFEEEIFKIIPELKYEKDFEQKSEWHCYDVWNHTVHAVNSCDKEVEDRLILLLHDIGKPFSYQDEGNIRHFKNHALKSKELSKPILERLNVPKEKIKIFLKLIEMHSSKICIEEINSNNKDFYKRLLKIKFCDASAYEKAHSKYITDELETISKKLIK